MRDQNLTCIIFRYSSYRIRHRGPDWSGTWTKDGTVFAHERLAIVDVENGAQPLVAADGSGASNFFISNRLSPFQPL